MDSINEKKITDPFPFESLHRLRKTVPSDIQTTSDYEVQHFDNRGRISKIAASLRSKLGFFQTRMAASSFLSDAFSWQIKTAQSSDPERLLSKAASFSDRVDYSVRIDSLATSQTAVSNKYASDDVVDFDTGTYSYTLTIDDTAYDIDVEIENKIGDPATYRSVLLAVERSVNRLGLDVSAQIENTKQTDYIPYRGGNLKNFGQLIVSSKATGEQTGFSMEDTSGNLIETLGLNKTSRFGHKNQYQVNGEQARADSNQIPVSSGNITGYLFGVTNEAENLKITVDQDKKMLGQELEQIIGDYNTLVHWIDDNENVISPSLKAALFKELPSLATRNQTVKPAVDSKNGKMSTVYSDFASVINTVDNNTVDSELTAIGLTLNTDGSLDIGDDFAASVAGNLRQVHDVLAGETGFFTRISEAIDDIQGKKEQNYIIPLNSILSYDANGTNRQSVYKSRSGSIISFFA